MQGSRRSFSSRKNSSLTIIFRLELAEELPRLLEAGDRVDRGLARVAAADSMSWYISRTFRRPLRERVEVLLLRSLAQAEVVRELLDLAGSLRLGLVEDVLEQAVAELACLLEVLRVDAGDELRVLALELARR